MVQSVNRALRILKVLGKENRKCSVKELSMLTGLAPSTIHRLLMTLLEGRFVAKDTSTSLYYLGPSLVALGVRAGNFIDLRNAAMPIMRELSSVTGEDSYLAMTGTHNTVIIERIPGPQPLKIIDPFNQEVSLHCGAMRKILLAYKDNDYIKCYLEGELKRFTNNTIIDADALHMDLVNIRRDKVAVSLGEYIKDAVGISVPVFDKYGTVVSSLGVIGPLSRFDEETIETRIQQVVKYGHILSNELGHDFTY